MYSILILYTWRSSVAAREMSTPVMVGSRGSRRRAAQKRRPDNPFAPADAALLPFAPNVPLASRPAPPPPAPLRLVLVNVRERLVCPPAVANANDAESNERSVAKAPATLQFSFLHQTSAPSGAKWLITGIALFRNSFNSRSY